MSDIPCVNCALMSLTPHVWRACIDPHSESTLTCALQLEQLCRCQRLCLTLTDKHRTLTSFLGELLTWQLKSI